MLNFDSTPKDRSEVKKKQMDTSLSDRFEWRIRKNNNGFYPIGLLFSPKYDSQNLTLK